MSSLYKLYRFLGSVYFAILLIATVAFLVIVGTFIESRTASHQYASLLTYNSPLFFSLLALFFINILFSALQRWPFKGHHIPFLLTHLGLLMIIAGVFIKNMFGVQGAMGILEGSACDTIFFPNTHIIQIEKKSEPQKIQQVPLKALTSLFKNASYSPFPNLRVELMRSFPHSQEEWDLWIKGDYAMISGLPPLPVVAWDGSNPELPLPAFREENLDKSFCFQGNVYACRTANPIELAKRMFIKNMAKPTLAVMQDLKGDDYLFALDSEGHVHFESFDKERLSSLIVYERGFGGYAVQARLRLAKELLLECPITCRHRACPPSRKLEDNKPCVVLLLSEGKQKEGLSLAYDRFGRGLKWPALGGRYLLRFQPKFYQIPYRLRLRDARQIPYPGSQQPYSFECDLIVTDKEGKEAEVTLSMNHVHETSKGYRFYLANIYPSEEISAQYAQIVVNYDPAKYLLTYPGAVLLAIGIVLLFWLRPYSKRA